MSSIIVWNKSKQIAKHVCELFIGYGATVTIQLGFKIMSPAARAANSKINAARCECVQHPERFRDSERTIVTKQNSTRTEPDARRFGNEPTKKDFRRTTCICATAMVFSHPIRVHDMKVEEGRVLFLWAINLVYVYARFKGGVMANALSLLEKERGDIQSKISQLGDMRAGSILVPAARLRRHRT